MTHRIAHVDDDTDIREAVSLVLRAEGYLVDSYETMQELSAVLKTTATPPDLAILDVMVETMDAGLKCYEEIHRDYPRILTIFMTCLGELIRPHFDDKADGWVWIMDKPVDPERLVATVKSRLASKQSPINADT